MRKPKFKKEEIRKALEENFGFISYTATALKCDADTIQSYLKKYPDLRETIRTQREKLIDRAERKLLKNIDEGKETSLIFFLKTQAKTRGYIEKSQLDVNAKVKITVGLPKEFEG